MNKMEKRVAVFLSLAKLRIHLNTTLVYGFFSPPTHTKGASLNRLTDMHGQPPSTQSSAQ